MRRMLDPKEAGGSLPSTIQFDSEGNRKVGKNLGVDGKLTLKSLVSASNPDGDITKELGGGGTTNTIYRHPIHLYDNKTSIYIVLYSYVATSFNLPQVKQRLSHYVQCSGCVKIDNTYCSAVAISYQSDKFNVEYTNSTGFTSITINTLSMSDYPKVVE